MVTLNKIKSVKKSVIKLLTANPKLRDNDDKLIATIWYNEVAKLNTDLSAVDFLKVLGKGGLTSPEAITRARRKAQQHNMELRGTSYQGRLKEEINIRRGINTDEII
jgi:hypothetical protein